MSIRVDLGALRDALADFDFAYLLTVSDDGRPHAVAVRPALADGVLTVAATGDRTQRNARARPDVSLVFPPRQAGGYSLIVDATVASPAAEVAAAAGPAELRVLPTHAVLHRPAPAGAAATPAARSANWAARDAESGAEAAQMSW